MNEFALLKNLYRDVKPAKFYLMWGLILYIPVTLLSILQPLLIGYTVQKAITTGKLSAVYYYGGAFFLIVAILVVCEYFQGLCLQVTGQRLVKNLRQKAFLKSLKLRLGFLDTMPAGRLITRLTNDAEAVVEMFSMGAVQIVGDCLFLVGTFFMLFLVDVGLSFWAALSLPMLAFGLFYFRRWTKKAYLKVRESLSILNSFLHEYLSGIASVQTFGQIHRVMDNFKTQNQNYLGANRQAIFLDAAIFSFVDLVSVLAVALVLAGAYELESNQALTIGVLVAFLESLSRFFQPVREFTNRYAVFQSSLVALERMYDLFSWPEEEDVLESAPINFSQSIQFVDVGFSYKTGEQVLQGVTFTLSKGERVALVGQTGAGKSTVIKLLNRFYPVSEGGIYLDGRNINTISLGDLRGLISMVPQEVFLFQGTLRDNLAFGRKDASDEDLWHALQVVQLADVIRNRQGLNTEVLAKGSNFSSGERSLLAFARALVVNPQIIILDEATGNIDTLTEHRLQRATKKLLENRTALIIAHRLSTVVDADRILVFHQGKIIEEGNHQELIKKDGYYKNLVRIYGQLSKA